jgi:hypothetical protein
MSRHDTSGGITLIVAGTILAAACITITTGSLIHWIPTLAGIYVGLKAAAIIDK